jgi:hypothetical protein
MEVVDFEGCNGCCYFVATLLLVKRLIINDVTDVAGFKTIYHEVRATD